MQNKNRFTPIRPNGFTLVELLVVIAIVGLLVALLLPALGSVRESSNRTMCASRMRQCGIAMHTYAESHAGYLPRVTGHGLDADESWLAKLGPYLEEVNMMLICPSDPEADYRQKNNLTSYALNGFCAQVDDEDHDDEDHDDEDHDDEDHDDEDHDDEDHDDEDHDHEDHDHEDHEHSPLAGAYANLHRLSSTSTTILLFEAAAGAHGDHVDSWDWFSEDAHADHDHSELEHFEEISAEIAVDRHRDSANYLYADGHVESVESEQIHHWIHEGTEAVNFARPR